MENFDYQRIEKAIQYIEKEFKNQPSLEKIADHVCLSPFHFQRMFKEWAGVSPKKFIQFLTLEHAKSVLKSSTSVFEASFQSGLSGPSRLHDLFVNIEGITPYEYKSKGNKLKIFYGHQKSPFGNYLLAGTERGICGLYFYGIEGPGYHLSQLQQNWTEATWIENQQFVDNYHDDLFPINFQKENKKLTLLLKGTNFQLNVWKALLNIPEGSLVSYDQIANHIGKPGASRAVGSAIGKNNIGYLIPCHRVINKVGAVGNYRWGSVRKKAIVGWEAARLENRVLQA